MDLNDNIYTDLPDDSKDERQNNEIGENETLNGNPKKEDEKDKNVNAEISRDTLNGVNNVANNTTSIQADLDSSNTINGSNNGANSNELKNNSNFPKSNSVEKSLEYLEIHEKENKLDKENESKLMKTEEEKKNENLPNDKNRNFENVSINISSKVPLSEKKSSSFINNGPFYIEVKGLLEVLNAQDFAKNVNMKNSDFRAKDRNALINKRSYSVPSKVASKNIPKDTINRQNSKTGVHLQKNALLSKSTNIQKKPPLLMKSLVTPPKALIQNNLETNENIRKSVDISKGKAVFRNLLKKTLEQEELKIKSKPLIKINFAPSKGSTTTTTTTNNDNNNNNNNNEEEREKHKAKMINIKAEKEPFKFIPKKIPFLIKEKNIKHKAPPKGNIKHTLHYLKKAAETKNKEENELSMPKNVSIKGINDAEKSVLLTTRKFIEKPKNTQKISSLKMVSTKREKAILDIKKFFKKKPISKLVNNLIPKEKEKKKKIILFKNAKVKKEQLLPKSSIENKISKLNDTTDTAKREIDDKEEVEKENIEIAKEKDKIKATDDKEELYQINNKDGITLDNMMMEYDTEREKSIDDKYEQRLNDLTENETEKEDRKLYESKVTEVETVKKVDDDEDFEIGEIKEVELKGEMKGQKDGEKVSDKEILDIEKREELIDTAKSLEPEKDTKEEEKLDDKQNLEAEREEKLWNNETISEDEKKEEKMDLNDKESVVMVKEENVLHRKEDSQTERVEEEEKEKEKQEEKEAKDEIEEINKMGEKEKQEKGEDNKQNGPENKKESTEILKEMKKTKNDIKKSADQKLNKKILKKGDNVLLKHEPIKSILNSKQDVKLPLNPKKNTKSVLNVKQIVKPELTLKHKATIKGNAVFPKLKSEVIGSANVNANVNSTGNLKEKRNIGKEKSNGLEKSSNINKSALQRKSTLFMKKGIGIKKISSSKNSIKDIDAEKKKGEKKTNGSNNDNKNVNVNMNMKMNVKMNVNMKKNLPDELQNSRSPSKKVSSTSFKSTMTILKKKKTLSKSKSDNTINEKLTNNSKTIVSSKSDNIRNMLLEQDKIIKKKKMETKEVDGANGTNAANGTNEKKGNDLNNKKTRNFKKLKLNRKCNTVDAGKFSSSDESDDENKKLPSEGNEISFFKGIFEMDKKTNNSLKKSKSLKKQKSKSLKKQKSKAGENINKGSDDISNEEDKLIKKIAKLNSSKKIKAAISSQMKMDKEMKKLKSGILHKETSNANKLKGKKNAKKLKGTNDNNGNDNVVVKRESALSEIELGKSKSSKYSKDKWNNNYVTPRMGTDKFINVDDESSESFNSHSSHRSSLRSVALSVSSKKLKKKKNIIKRNMDEGENYNIKAGSNKGTNVGGKVKNINSNSNSISNSNGSSDSNINSNRNSNSNINSNSNSSGLKKKAINMNIRNSNKVNGCVKSGGFQNIGRSDIPLFSPMHYRDPINAGDEERRNRSIGSTGFLNLRESSSFKFNRIKSTNALRNLSLQVKWDPTNDFARTMTTTDEPSLHVNNLYTKNVLRRRPSEIEKQSNWMFVKCCSNNKDCNFYERKEPVVQNFSSLVNENNKYISYNPKSYLQHFSSNTVKLSNMYESTMFTNKTLRRSSQVNDHVMNRQVKGHNNNKSNSSNRPLNSKMSSETYTNKAFFNSGSLKLKRRPSCIATTNYCSCI
ncbi:hypothetical protein MKS88_004296 [Plasmodium brasilianum]|uniref:Uncharacterized protein n=1 Tax=Plasmodium brasilianum TaxID=5824 RepID=A0ACB9Y6F2_PLABR|nr:hypothetical protein MKS88_004296 [Plasmodium brasilianum]